MKDWLVVHHFSLSDTIRGRDQGKMLMSDGVFT